MFLTVDQGIEYQQNLENRKLAIIILHARSNRVRDLLPLASICLVEIESLAPGDVVHVRPTEFLNR